MVRFLIYLILFYILFKAIRYFARFIFGLQNQKEIREEKSRLGIDKKDIIEADFEELKEKEDKNPGKDEK